MKYDLKIELVLIAIFLFIFIFHKLKSDGLNMRLSFPWLALSIFVVFLSLSSNWLVKIAEFVQVESPINFLFFSALVSLFIFSINNSFSSYRKEKSIRNLIQENSILRYEVSQLKKAQGLLAQKLEAQESIKNKD
jgi:hypothetical protein